MSDAIWRTGATTLTNNELILLDAMFDADVAFEMLRRDMWAAWHSFDYTHTLSDAALQHTLDSLIERNILRTFYYVYEPDSAYYGLTATGGAQWEAEHCPTWQHYFYVYTQQQDDQTWLWAVESPSLSTAKHVHRLAQSQFTGIPVSSTMQHMEKPHHRFLPWKIFPVIHSLSGITTRDCPTAIDLSSDDTIWNRVTHLLAVQTQRH